MKTRWILDWLLVGSVGLCFVAFGWTLSAGLAAWGMCCGHMALKPWADRRDAADRIERALKGGGND